MTHIKCLVNGVFQFGIHNITRMKCKNVLTSFMAFQQGTKHLISLALKVEDQGVFTYVLPV